VPVRHIPGVVQHPFPATADSQFNNVKAKGRTVVAFTSRVVQPILFYFSEVRPAAEQLG